MPKYIFKKQLAQRGCYSSIHLTAKHKKHEKSDLLINYAADKKWEFACKAGIQIFFDYFRIKNEGSLEVNVEVIDWLPVDTNHLIILYSTIIALSEELDFTIANLSLDILQEVFVIPEPRRSILNK